MAKLGPFMLFLLCPYLLYGQEFKLKSINEIHNDSLKSIYSRTDLNGNASAIMILTFNNPIEGIVTKGNIINQVQSNEKEVIVNVADGTKKITIQHDDFYPFVLSFKDYGFQIRGGHTYRAIMDNDQEEKSTRSGDSQYLLFKFEDYVKSLKINGIECLDTTKWHREYKKLVPLGVYKYEVTYDNGVVVQDQVEVKSKNFSKVVRPSLKNK